MGKACAQSYANIFMAKFEQKHICSFIKGIVDLCLRYIDKIFFHLERYGARTGKFL